MIRTRAGLHSNQTRRQLSQEFNHLSAPPLLLQYLLAIPISTMNLKNRLCQMRPDFCNIGHGRCIYLFALTQLSMAHCEVLGGVHTNYRNFVIGMQSPSCR